VEFEFRENGRKTGEERPRTTDDGPQTMDHGPPKTDYGPQIIHKKRCLVNEASLILN